LTREPDHPAVGSYLLEKGKKLATREDLNRIVATTEEIKAQDSGEWWIKQKRWETTFQCYSQVVEHLKAFFSGRRAVAIGQAEATAYVIKRQGEQASGATINRELAVLIRMLRPGLRERQTPPAAGSPEAQGGGAVLRVLRARAVRGCQTPSAGGSPGGRGDRLHLRLADAERGPGA